MTKIFAFFGDFIVLPLNSSNGYKTL